MEASTGGGSTTTTTVPHHVVVMHTVSAFVLPSRVLRYERKHCTPNSKGKSGLCGVLVAVLYTVLYSLWYSLCFVLRRFVSSLFWVFCFRCHSLSVQAEERDVRSYRLLLLLFSPAYLKGMTVPKVRGCPFFSPSVTPKVHSQHIKSIRPSVRPNQERKREDSSCGLTVVSS